MTSRQKRPGYHCKSQVSLLAKVTSQVHIITWQDLLRVMRVYPDIRQRVMEQMELSFELDSSDMVRDLWVRRYLVLIIWWRWGRRCHVDVNDNNDDNNNEALRFPNEREQEIQCAKDHVASVAWRSSQSGRARNRARLPPLLCSRAQFLALPDWLERQDTLAKDHEGRGGEVNQWRSCPSWSIFPCASENSRIE